MGRLWVAQEYECSFEAMEGLVYPDFAQCLTDFSPALGKPYGGIDWGWPSNAPGPLGQGCQSYDEGERRLKAFQELAIGGD